MLALPTLVVLLGSCARVAAGITLLVASAPVGYVLARGTWKWALLTLWVLIGAAELALFLYHPSPRHFGLLNLLGAGISGAVLGCVWFGWYLAVASSFDGHNNEVGGACRIERFKGMIRFRLTPTGLTAFVIGFDQPKIDARALSLQLVDVFELRAG